MPQTIYVILYYGFYHYFHAWCYQASPNLLLRALHLTASLLYELVSLWLLKHYLKTSLDSNYVISILNSLFKLRCCQVIAYGISQIGQIAFGELLLLCLNRIIFFWYDGSLCLPYHPYHMSILEIFKLLKDVLIISMHRAYKWWICLFSLLENNSSILSLKRRTIYAFVLLVQYLFYLILAI